MPKSLTLGIDLGGTGIKLGLVTPQGRLLRTLKFSTPSKSDPQGVVDLILQQSQMFLEAVGKKRIRGVGIGTAGDVEPGKGVVRISPNLNWHNVPLKALLSR